jgi:phage terminase large subunit-like protein
MQQLNKAQLSAAFEKLSPEARAILAYSWQHLGRFTQQPPPGDWRKWLILAGRGWGKTRTGAEWVRAQAEANPRARIAIIAETAHDGRSVMVGGQSGILACCPPWAKPKYTPTQRLLEWPNGAIATTYSGDEPGQLRGPQFTHAWCDEIAKWRHAQESWDNLMLSLRLGISPRAVITTTPRPTKIIKNLLNDPTATVTRGSTFDNSGNLPPSFLAEITQKYASTCLGRQELYAEVLDDVPGALWSRATIDDCTRQHLPAVSDMRRIVVAIDPAVTSGEKADETGIIVAGLDVNGMGWVLADLSGRMAPNDWASKAVQAYHQWQADRIVAEDNNGGEMVSLTIRTVDPRVPVKRVRASRGKIARAEPVAALYEQKKVRHAGYYDALSQQMISYTGDSKDFNGSPDRLDALVWALTELMISPRAEPRLRTI